MPKTSKIPHKTTTSLTINKELLMMAKQKGINISLLLDAALERELNPQCQDAYFKALESKMSSIVSWMEKNPKIEEAYYKNLDDDVKGGEKNVRMVKEERIQQDIGQVIRSIKDN